MGVVVKFRTDSGSEKTAADKPAIPPAPIMMELSPEFFIAQQEIDRCRARAMEVLRAIDAKEAALWASIGTTRGVS